MVVAAFMMLNEFYRVTFRRKLYQSLEELQVDLDGWRKDLRTVRHGRDQLGQTRGLDGFVDVRVCSLRACVSNIFANRCVFTTQVINVKC